MTKLSICIPVEPGSSVPLYLVTELLRQADADLEIIVAPYGDSCAEAGALYALAGEDARLKILPAAPTTISACGLWIGTVAATAGDWVTLVRPDDMIEPDLAGLLAHIEATMPEVDAYGWNTFQIDAGAARDIAASIPIPIQHHSLALDKTDMLQAFFQWNDSSNVPKMPFGLFHGAIKRSLLETVLANSGPTSWLTPLPQYEWASRVLIYGTAFGFSSRPLSAVDVRPFQPVDVPSAVAAMPFDARIGLTAAIAEIQVRVLQDLGTEWGGYSEAFIRACMLDCMFEHDEDRFERKAQAYHAAMRRFQGGRLAASFQPPYLAEPKPDPRRGLHERILLVNRFIGNAQTAQEFYKVARGMLAPIAIIRERPDELIVGTREPLALSA